MEKKNSQTDIYDSAETICECLRLLYTKKFQGIKSVENQKLTIREELLLDAFGDDIVYGNKLTKGMY